MALVQRNINKGGHDMTIEIALKQPIPGVQEIYGCHQLKQSPFIIITCQYEQTANIVHQIGQHCLH